MSARLWIAVLAGTLGASAVVPAARFDLDSHHSVTGRSVANDQQTSSLSFFQ